MTIIPITSVTRVRLSVHAVQRWCERVDPRATQLEARFALSQLVCNGRVRATPRHWTDADPAPGLTFVYWAQRPSICALIVDGVVVTVLTRAFCRSTAPRGASALRAVGADPKDRARRKEPAPAWCWDHRRDAA
jgi:hypothetical protein